MRPKAMRRMPLTRLRGASLGLAAAAALLSVPAGAQGATRGAPIAPEQPVVSLMDIKSVHAAPDVTSSPLVAVAYERPITLTRTILPVLAQKQDAAGQTWLKVRLPGRVFDRLKPPPSGWITASDTRRATLRWHVVVDVDARRVLAYRDGRMMRSFRVIVGKPSTPTPRGEFFVEETLRMPSGAGGGPFALATSARSHVYQEFEGGPGQIALHGVQGIGGTMGTAVSHGCVRMTTAAISWLAQYVKAGVPLTIR
jgi:lipoprotein-anchoring transpeptidase ErfK/SrfK